ncbi:FIST C-terminal domain-containing protein [bacterium]|nr:FIST C-terminal domain-containing protein [bacterium]MBU1995161.1 FIST C-terminal domain-containing protein [bacterium]
MKTLNTLYEDIETLEKYIFSHQIEKNPNVLVQVFSGIVDTDFINLLIFNIKKFIPHVKIIGSTTDGEIIENSVQNHSTILSFSIFDKTVIKTHYVPYNGSSEALAASLIQQFENQSKIKLMITFVDGLHTNGEKYIKFFEDYNQNLVIAGGLSGDNAEFKETLVFTEEGCYNNGAVAAVFYNDELIVNTVKSFGWKRIGKKLKVTRSKENIVYTIDNISATDIYKKYLGQAIADELPATGIEFPLIIHRNGIDIARAVVDKEDKTGALIFAGNVSEGESVQFGYGDIDSIRNLIDATNNAILDKPIESIFVYSCMARKRLMGKNVLTEIIPLAKLAPTAGFFTYGELFTQGNKHELLNQTMTILTISEENSCKIQQVADKKTLNIRSNKTITALTHLVGVSTDELTELNKTLENKIKEEVEKNRTKDKQLLQQSRLAQMGEMISMIAHQWRQPLSAIGSAAAGLRLKAQLKKATDEMVVEICNKILFSSKHLSATIDDFRDFYKADKEVKETTFGEVLDGVLNIIKGSVENKNIAINIELGNNNKISTHANELKQVVMNLIKNAEDILLDNSVKNPYIKIRTSMENGKNILEVSDNGGGIDADKIDFVFDPYFSTKTSKDGTGIGLYMSKIIIEEHCGGKLSVSNNDVGALFKIELD